MSRKVRSRSKKSLKKTSKKGKVGVKSKNSRKFNVIVKKDNGTKKEFTFSKKGRFFVTIPKDNKAPPINNIPPTQNVVRKTLFNNEPEMNTMKKSNESIINSSNNNRIERNNKQNKCLQKSDLTERQLEIKNHILKLIKELAGDRTYENRIENGNENTAPFRITPMEVILEPEYKEIWEGGDEDIVEAKMKYGFEVTQEEDKCLKKVFFKRRKSKKVKKHLKNPLAKGKKPKNKSNKIN